MKKVFLSLLASVAVLSAAADGKSEAVLDAMASKMKSFDAYALEFTLTMEGEFGDTQGSVTVSGDKYRIETEGMEVISDGSSKYTVIDDEAILEDVTDADPADFLSSPSQFFDQDYSAFTHTHKGTATVNGRNADIVELKPKDTGLGITSIVLYTDSVSKLPLRLETIMGQTGIGAVIMIDKFTSGVSPAPAFFTFDKSKYPDVEIIDFR